MQYYTLNDHCVHRWGHPYSTLSRGERHQASIARVLGRHHIAIDEFTSYLDRATAKSLAHGKTSV